MTIYKYIKKLFLNSKILLPLYVIFIGFTLEYSVKLLIRSSDILMADKALGSFSVYCFVFFTYISFEFCRKCKKDNIEECLQSISGGYKQVLKSQLLLLNNLILIFTAIILILQFAQYIKIGYSFNFMYIIYLLLKVALYYYLVPVTGAFLGLTFALTSNRLNSYLMLILITLLGTPFFRTILDMLYDTAEINLFPIFQIFDIFPHDLNFTANYAFDTSVLPHVWLSCIFWCSLSFVIAFYKLSVPKTPKIILKKLPVLILCAACFITAIIPSSKVQVEYVHPYESVDSEWSYYVSHKKKAESVPVVNEAFSVTEYDAELTIGSKLYATIKITPDNKELNEYVFTLFHEYKISKITDENNNKLKFTQDSDYVTVYTSGTINQLCFTYSGFSGTFYSNVQGTFLPGFFPYLPFPGCKAIYNADHGGSFNVLSFGDEADISVKVNSLRQIYCNLEKTGRNTFSGKSNGLTLISGFYDEITVNDITTVRPYMDYTRESNKNITKMINMNSDNPEFNNVKTILIMPHVNLSLTGHEQYIVFSDHIVSSQTYSLMH
jgi:hypothetical protein